MHTCTYPYPRIKHVLLWKIFRATTTCNTYFVCWCAPISIQCTRTKHLWMRKQTRMFTWLGVIWLGHHAIVGSRMPPSNVVSLPHKNGPLLPPVYHSNNKDNHSNIISKIKWKFWCGVTRILNSICYIPCRYRIPSHRWQHHCQRRKQPMCCLLFLTSSRYPGFCPHHNPIHALHHHS